MSHRAARPGLACLTVNAHGLATPGKLLGLMHFCKQNGVQIALVQETHLQEDPSTVIGQVPGSSTVWPGVQIFFCPGMRRSKGCMVLIDRSCVLQSAKVYTPSHLTSEDSKQRILRLDFTCQGAPVTIINVYAPADAGARPGFYEDMLPAYLPTDDRAVLLAGDLNCVLDAHVDVYREGGGGVGGSQRSSRTVGARELQALMHQFDLHDVWRQHHGAAKVDFTRFDHQHKTGARLDRWLASASSLRTFEVEACDILPSAGISTDHLPVLLRLRLRTPLPRGAPRRPFPLLLLNMQNAVDDLSNYMAGKLVVLDTLTADADLPAAWDRFKEELRRKALEVYAHHRQLALAPVHFAAASAEAHRRGLLAGTTGSAVWAQAVHAANRAYISMARDLGHAAAVLNHLYGDTSSYYFHAQAKEIHEPCVIANLHRPGTLDSDDRQTVSLATRPGTMAALNYAVEFFSSASPVGLYRPAQTRPQAQDTLLASLRRRAPPDLAAQAEGLEEDGTISSEELAVALDRARRGSAPGVDGIPYEVYRGFKSALGPALIKLYNSALRPGARTDHLAPLLQGTICLLPKVGQPTDDLVGYRPLTLLNSDIKILMLIMSDRLQRPLEYLIDITQSAFLAGRDISDNVRYHLGLQARLEELGLPGWLLVSDLAKAYDSVDRVFLRKVMLSMGLRESGIVRLMDAVMTGTTACVRINGFYSAVFPVTRSLPQGGSVSCQGWAIVMEPLVSYLNTLQSGKPLPTVLTMPDGSMAPAAPSYADDVSPVVTDPSRDIPSLQGAFTVFRDASGVAQSFTKSHLLCLSAPRGVPDELDPHLHDAHLPSGYRLAKAVPPVRHLGVPISTDAGACADAAFANLAGSIHAATHRWRGLMLNQQGRSHVSVQCLASKAVYQSQFHVPPANAIRDAQKAIDHFVAASTRPEEATPNRSCLYPRFDISALPPSKGGMGHPVLDTQFTAMRAKPGWLLFRHSSHPWHQLFSHEVTRAGPAAGLGYARGPHWLVTNPGAGNIQGIATPSYRANAHAFLQLGIRRVMDVALQSFHSVMLEHTFHNSAAALQLLPTTLNTDVARTWLRLRDVRHACQARGDLTAAVAADLDTILQRLPQPWRTAVLQPEVPVARWRALSDPDDEVQVFAGPDPLRSGLEPSSHILWRLVPTGRLVPLFGCLYVMPPDNIGRATATVLRVKPKNLWGKADHAYWQAQLHLPAAQRVPVREPILIGIYEDMHLDPEVWGISKTKTLANMSAKFARVHLRHHAAAKATGAKKIPGYAEAGAVWPALWSLHVQAPPPAAGNQPSVPGQAPAEIPHDPSSQPTCGDGIQGLERRWLASVAAGPLHIGGASTSTAANRLLTADFNALENPPPWFETGTQLLQRSPRPVAAQAPHGGGGSADGGAAPPGERPANAGNDVVRPPARGPAYPPDFPTVWCNLSKDATLHRQHRITCWRALHGTLGCNAFMFHCLRTGSALCEHPACTSTGMAETLSHAFIDCPASRPAVEWLCATWAALTHGPAPPCTAAVLLADDHRAGWAPQDAALRLWTRLRVAVIGSIWQARCFRADVTHAGGAQESLARRAVREAVNTIVGAIHRDWARVEHHGVRHLANGIFCQDWWRGMDAAMDSATFKAVWAQPPILCSVDDRRLALRIGLDGPVALPL